MDDDYLNRCVVDTSKRSIRIYSNSGEEREIKCDSTEEFMNVLSFVRETLDEDTLSYANPL